MNTTKLLHIDFRNLCVIHKILKADIIVNNTIYHYISFNDLYQFHREGNILLYLKMIILNN